MSEVGRRYGEGQAEVVALRAIDLTVAAGELVAVMGPSGSGKSTLLNLAGGLDSPTTGTVSVAGRRLDQLDASGLAALRRRSIGYVFQRLNLLPALTAVENVMLPLELDGARPAPAMEQAIDALQLAGFTGSVDRYPDDLAGGEQQRVAIARAVVGERRLLLADEPTGALDTATGERVLELLAGRAAAGVAVVLVTHEPRFASYADRVVLLRDGAQVETSDVGR
jgi:putative ABC transport system ATP-binding protein